jgi:hypothetical protein
MAEEGEDDGLSPNEILDMISKDEAIANTGDEMTPSVRHEGPGTEPAQPGEGGSTSAYDLCIVNWTLNSLS